MEDRAQNLAKFLEVVTALGLEDPFIAYYYELMVKNTLSEYQYKITKELGQEKNKVEYRVDLALDSAGEPYVKGYRVTMLDTHPLEHGVFAGIDTRELEERMKGKDWNNNLPDLPEVFRDIIRLKLSGSDKAIDVAERLEARYWLGTPVEMHLNIKGLKEKFSKEHYFGTTAVMASVTAKKAFNLLSGRYIVRFEDVLPGIFSANWTGLKQVGSASSDKVFEEVLYPDFGYGVHLRELGVTEMASPESGVALLGSLMDGDLASANLATDGLEIPVYLSVDPVKKCINVLDRDMKVLDIGKTMRKSVEKGNEIDGTPPVRRKKKDKGRKKSNGKGI